MKVFTNRVLYGIREKRHSFLCHYYVGCNKKQIKECGNAHVDKVAFEQRDVPCFNVIKNELQQTYISLAQKHILQDWRGFCDRVKDNIFVINNFPNDKFRELALDTEESGANIIPEERTTFCFVYIDTRNDSNGSVWILDIDIKNNRHDILSTSLEGAISYSVSSYKEEGEESFDDKYVYERIDDNDTQKTESNECTASNIAVMNAIFILLNRCKNYGRVWKNGMGLTFSDYHSPIVNKTGLTLIAYDNE